MPNTTDIKKIKGKIGSVQGIIKDVKDELEETSYIDYINNDLRDYHCRSLVTAHGILCEVVTWLNTQKTM